MRRTASRCGGTTFRPDYRRLGELRRSLPGVPFLALTATATERVREDIVEQLQLERPERFVASFNRANLSYTVLPKQGRLLCQACGVAGKAQGGVGHHLLHYPQMIRRRWLAVCVGSGLRRTALSCRAGRWRASSDPGGVHTRPDRDHRSDDRVWHGDRQVEYPAARPLRSAQVAGELLPGDGTRRS